MQNPFEELIVGVHLAPDPTAMEINFAESAEPIAVIDSKGVFRVNVDPTDENTLKFIKLVNEHLLAKAETELTRIEVIDDVSKRE